ncbi:hypothetical protein [Pseudorhodoplanes sp.]|uniref:hypothetical protein n=1 Tax=Pseudorhodoplanes sp. TaxID=1934341 RepID=UPI003D0EBB39
MTTTTTSGDSIESRRSEQDLGRRYGRIAISALVAALPYGGETRTAASETADSDAAERRKGRAA